MQTNREKNIENRDSGAFFVAFNHNESENISPSIQKSLLGKWYNWGQNNDYPDFLASLIKKSTTHSNLIEFLTIAVAGNGVKMVNADGSENIEAQRIWDDWNNRDITSTLLERLAKDLVTYGGISPTVRWSIGAMQFLEENESVDVSPEIMPSDSTISVWYSAFKNFRAGIPENSNNIDGYYFSRDWLNYSLVSDEVEYVPKFDVNTAHLDSEQVMYLFKPNDISDAYPSPSYTSAIDAILTEGALMNYHKNNVQNSFQPSGILEVEKFREVKQLNEFKYQLTKTYQGTENAGGVMVVETDGRDASKVNFIPINTTDATDRYISLANELAQRIASAHGAVSTSIVGQIGSTGFSSNAEELAMSFAIMNLKRIECDQRILERAITTMFKYVEEPARGAIAHIETIDYLELLNLTTEPEPNADINS